MPPPGSEPLARQLAAVGEPQRLAMVALLARRPHYGEELAEVLGVHPATASHHLRRLRDAGLVTAERHPPYILFSLDRLAWADVVATLDDPAALAVGFGLPSEEELSGRILHRWVDAEGRIPELPKAPRDRRVVLRHVLERFETGRIYPEREVRRVLLEFSDDPNRLEEAMVDLGWLQRGQGVVRRIPEVGE